MNNNITYLSAEALESLKIELIHRSKVKRQEIAQKIGDAKELGDISENFEYHDAKEQQGQNEVRIAQIMHMISTAVIVDAKKGGVIGLGSQFTVEGPSGEKTFSLVGENEASPLTGRISNVSPLGAAFIGKGVGETADITTPGGSITYKVLRVS